MYISRRLVFSESDKTGVPQVVVRCPPSEFTLSDQHRFQPQCRMPDYAVCIFRNEILEAIRSQFRESGRASNRHSPWVKDCPETTASGGPHLGAAYCDGYP